MVISWCITIYFLTLLKTLHDALILNRHVLSSWKWYIECQTATWAHTNKAPELVILLPVLREQKHLQMTLHYLEQLSYPGRKRIVVITTEREIAENNGVFQGTTVEHAKNIIAVLRNQSVSSHDHIHYPYTIGNKADQLNYALDHIIKHHKNLSTLYIGVYDADSRPDPNTFLNLYTLIAREEEKNRGWPIAIQQPALFLGNFQRISWYLQLEALFETRWVLGHEIHALRTSTRSIAQHLPPYAYCVGHGMFIRADFLQKTGGFPQPSEDVPLGHRLTFLGIPIHPLPTFDLCDVASDVPSLIRQSGFWFCNAPLIWREYDHVKRLKLPFGKGRSLLLLLKGLVDIFSWIHYPLHLLALLFLLTFGRSWIYACFSLLTCYLDAGIGMMLMLLLFPSLSRFAFRRTVSLRLGVKAWLILCSPLRNMVRGLAPILAAWYFIQTIFFKRVNVLPKTAR